MWHSDVAGELGRGHVLSVELEPGRHLITATIPGGGANDRVEATGIIVVGGRGRGG